MYSFITTAHAGQETYENVNLEELVFKRNQKLNNVNNKIGNNGYLF
jgi:hypothetical protein